MLRSFKALEKDPDIEARQRLVGAGGSGVVPSLQVNDVAIKELLSLEVPPMEMNEKNKLIARPVTKHRIMDLCLSCSHLNVLKAASKREVRGFEFNSSSSARPPSRRFRVLGGEQKLL